MVPVSGRATGTDSLNSSAGSSCTDKNPRKAICIADFIVVVVGVNPSNASGLDVALKSLAAIPFGTVFLLVGGVGLIAYGVYTFAWVRLARL